MADAPKILGTDTLRQAYPKINAAIDNANEALNKATTAETNSTNAVNTANSVQQQLNQIVIEGDSSVEAAQARVNAEGRTFTTLKERLDDSDNKIGILLDTAKRISNRMIEDKVEIIAHRGFMYLYPQNTMIAFTNAIAAGADSLETDIRMTADGIPVLSHDNDLSVNTTGTGKISEKSLAEIKQYDAGVKFHPKFAGAKIPTFDEFVKFAKGKAKMIYPEIKGYHDISDISIMVQVVKDNLMEKNCCFCSFSLSDLIEVRNHSETVKIALLKDATYPTQDEISFLENDGNAALMPVYNSITTDNPTLLGDMYQRGIDVICYNVWSFDVAQQLLNKGVTKMITDYYYGGL